MKVKKVILTAVAAIAMSTAANAQFFINGGLSLSHNAGESKVSNVTVDDPTNNHFSINVNGGYYFTENFAAGLNIQFSTDKANADQKNWSRDNTFYINPYVRYDFIVTDKISFGATATAILGFGREGKMDNYDGNKAKQFGVSIAPVIDYKFNNHWSAYTSFGNLYFISSKVGNDKNYDNYDKETDLGIDLSMTALTFGVRYTF